jgi:hypothetical protein
LCCAKPAAQGQHGESQHPRHTSSHRVALVRSLGRG